MARILLQDEQRKRPDFVTFSFLAHIGQAITFGKTDDEVPVV
jgi:hypothetical protein